MTYHIYGVASTWYDAALLSKTILYLTTDILLDMMPSSIVSSHRPGNLKCRNIILPVNKLHVQEIHVTKYFETPK